MKQFFTTLLLVSACSFTSFSQSLFPGQITGTPANRILLAQRFKLDGAAIPGNKQVLYIGSNLDNENSRLMSAFPYDKQVNFTIEYSVSKNTFSNTMEMRDASGKIISGNIVIESLTHFVGSKTAAQLGYLNFMELRVKAGATNTAIVISDLKLNGADITGSYESVHDAETFWHTISADLNSDFVISGTLHLDGEFVASDNDLIEFNFGYTTTLSRPESAVNWGEISIDQKGESNIITWMTRKEENNDRFIVEKSIDGLKFYGIGLITGAGTKTIATHYIFTDKEIESGTCYYRIRQVDFEGHNNYSVVVPVRNIVTAKRESNNQSIVQSVSTTDRTN
jgi:hypothetical protein